MKLIFIVLIPTLSACSVKSTATKNKLEIKPKMVESIVVKQNFNDPSSIRLTSDQSKEFVNKWNNAKFKSLCKFIPELWFVVLFKDGSTRTFKANGKNIIESKDLCFNIGDSEYFERIWVESQY